MKCIAVFQKELSGFVTFSQDDKDSEVRVSGNVTNLKEGKHGFHIHKYGNLLKANCSSCAGHWNPYNKNHGSRTDDLEKSHAGDLGNVSSNEENISKFYFKTTKITLYGKYSIIGRSIVIHKDEDDNGCGGYEDSLTTGHAGARLDCAVIGIMEE